MKLDSFPKENVRIEYVTLLYLGTQKSGFL